MNEQTPVFEGYEVLDQAYSDPNHLMFKKMAIVTGMIVGGEAILDYGCGNGELLSRVGRRFRRVVGVDATDASVERTCKRLEGNRNAAIYKYDGEMPKVKGGFDYVTCLDVLEHLEEPGNILKEIKNLMAPGGRLIVSVPNWYDFIVSRILRLNKYHLHAHTPWGWMKILKNAGFKTTGCRAAGFPLVNSDLLARKVYGLGMCIIISAVNE